MIAMKVMITYNAMIDTSGYQKRDSINTMVVPSGIKMMTDDDNDHYDENDDGGDGFSY